MLWCWQTDVRVLTHIVFIFKVSEVRTEQVPPPPHHHHHHHHYHCHSMQIFFFHARNHANSKNASYTVRIYPPWITLPEFLCRVVVMGGVRGEWVEVVNNDISVAEWLFCMHCTCIIAWMYNCVSDCVSMSACMHILWWTDRQTDEYESVCACILYYSLVLHV